MAMLKFLKGNYASLNAASIAEGQVLICGDTGEMFVDVAADKRVKIGDFITVANIEALEALDATAVPTSRLYYVEDGNILARSNGTAWVQVNKQKTAAELKEMLGLGSLAYLSEVGEANLASALKNKINAAATQAALDEHIEAAEAAYETKTDAGAKLTEAKGYTDAEVAKVQGAIDELEEYVGVIPEGATATDIVGYIQEKTAGIATDTALAELQEAVDAAEEKITALENANAEGGAVDTKIDEAKQAGLDAQADVDALTDKVGTIPEGKTIVGMIAEAQEAATYDDEEVRGLIADNAEAIEALEGTHSTDKAALEGAIALKADKTTVEGIDDRLEAAEGEIATIKGDYLKAADKTELQGNIDTVAGAVERLTNGVSADEIDGVNDLINYVNTHGTEVTGMKNNIQANADAIAAIEEDYLKEEDKTALQGSIDGVAGRMTTAEGEIDALQADSHTHANSAELAKIAEGDVAKWNGAQAAAEATAAAALAAAKTELEGKITAEATTARAAEKANADAIDVVEGRLDTLEAIDHEAYKAADETVLATAKSYADGKDEAIAEAKKAGTDAQSAVNTLSQTHATDKAALEGSIATKANSADVYAKTETYTQDEVDAAIEGALTEAMSWGSF